MCQERGQKSDSTRGAFARWEDLSGETPSIGAHCVIYLAR